MWHINESSIKDLVSCRRRFIFFFKKSLRNLLPGKRIAKPVLQFVSPVSTRSLKRTRRAPRTDGTNYCTWPCDCGGTITSITNQTNAHVLVTVPPQRRAEVPIRTLGERVYFMYRTKLLSFGLWALFKWNRTQTPVLEATSSSRSSVNHSHTLFHTSLRTDLCVLRAVNSPTRTLSHLPRRLVYIRLYSLYIQYDIWSFFFFFCPEYMFVFYHSESSCLHILLLGLLLWSLNFPLGLIKSVS